MADKRLTQSPRALRDSTNDPEKYGKGDVQIDQDVPRKGGEHTTRDGGGDPWRHQEDRYSPKYEARGHEPRSK